MGETPVKTPWTLQQASSELGVDEGYLRRVLNGAGIPGVKKIGRQWLGDEKHWRAWNESRPKRRKRE